MFLQYGELQPTNGWDLLASLGHPRKFQRVYRVFSSLLNRRRSTEVNQTLHDVSPSRALVYYVCILWGSCPLTEFCRLQNSLCVQGLRSPKLAALLHGTRAVGVSQSLRRGARNEITELSQRAPPIFGRAAITLGIGPHSSCWLISYVGTWRRRILKKF